MKRTIIALGSLGAMALQTMAGNVLLGAPVTLTGTFGLDGWGGGVLAPAASLTDGIFHPASTQWDQNTVWWDERNPSSVGNSVEIWPSAAVTVNRFVVQADDNDSYLLEYFDGSSWQTAWSIPAVGGWGMQTRDSGMLTPITATAFRFSATGGDQYYSVSEIQACIPEPAEAGLMAGVAAIGYAICRRRSAR
jgi:hypothetical protein